MSTNLIQIQRTKNATKLTFEVPIHGFIILLKLSNAIVSIKKGNFISRTW